MPRYAAFLRGVMPTNCRMADLKKAFEAAGFSDVVTVLSSGNVVFSAPKAKAETLQRRAEAAMFETMGRVFIAFVRSVDELKVLLDDDPFARFKVGTDRKRIITFVRIAPKKKLKFPVIYEGATAHGMRGGEIFSSYLPSGHSPDFMKMIQTTFGKDVTTRTVDTVRKVAAK